MSEIRINVFDLTSLNNILRFAKLGVYHTSIVIDGISEFYYGFAEYNMTGIDTPEEIDHIPSSMVGELYAQIEMGKCQYDYGQCIEIVRTFISSECWLSDHYNMLLHNCNDFTYELALALFGPKKMKKYPSWVQRGVKVGRWVFYTSIGYILQLSGKDIPGLGSLPSLINSDIEMNSFDENQDDISQSATMHLTEVENAC